MLCCILATCLGVVGVHCVVLYTGAVTFLRSCRCTLCCVVHCVVLYTGDL